MILAAGSYTLMALASTPSSADVSARKPVDPKSQFAKLVGEITQLDGEKVNMSGNAFVVGSEGCFVLTNFHVAFGKGRDKETLRIELVENIEVGHTVNFAYDFDAESGKFQRKAKAEVVDFGNYEEGTSRGYIGDIAILRLEKCLGKGYAHLEFDRPPTTKRIATGRLMTVSTTQNHKNGRMEMLVEEGCRSLIDTPVTGLMLSTCEIRGGMSGSMILEEGLDGKWRLVGISTFEVPMKSGLRANASIYASAINKFVDPILGTEATIGAAPSAEGRKLESAKTP